MSKSNQNYLSRALLTRAALFRFLEYFQLAQQDIDDVLEATHSGSIDFYQADAYLEKAYLHLAMSRATPGEVELENAATSLDRAKTLINDMGYHRRDGQVAALEAMLGR